MSEETFERWWQNEGSGLPPLKGEDQESHAQRIAAIAWSNGEYTADARTRLIVQGLNSAVLDLKAGVKELTAHCLLRDEQLAAYEEEGEWVEVHRLTWRTPALLLTAFVGLAYLMSRFL